MKFGELFPVPQPQKENPEREDARKRVVELKEKDNHYEDSMHDLALAEDAHRELLKKRGIADKELLNELGDIHSTETLGRMRAEKERHEDSMTGLRNRKAFDAQVLYLLNLEHRMGQNCALIMLDFDHFKRVNDEHGHPAGDEALRQIAKIINGAIRSSDVAYRYGGEEFAVILPAVDAVGAMVVAERIRKSVEDAIIAVPGKNGNTVELRKTISLGIADTENIDAWHGSDKGVSSDVMKEKVMDVLVANADKALYAAKDQGRNQTAIFREDMQVSEAA